MLGNSTNNFNNLTGSLCRLNHSNNATRSGGTQQTTANTAPAFQGNVNNADSGLASSFNGFKGDVGQRYSMPNDQAVQLLQMFLSVLEELMNTVVNNSQNREDGGQQQGQQGDSGNTQSQTNASGAGNTNSVGTQNTATNTNGKSAANNAAGASGNANNAGTNAVSNTQGADSVDSTTGAASNEAAQTHKTGGCPFMAMPDQSAAGNAEGAGQNTPANNQNASAQATVPANHPNTNAQQTAPANNQNTSNQQTAPANNQNSQPATGVSGPEGNSGVAAPDKADDRSIDYSNLSKEERSDMGLDDRERGVIHLWGRQMLSAGEQNGGIYTNVLGPDGSGDNWANKEEVALVKELRAAEQERFGNDTGWMLDEMYFDIMKEKTGIDMSTRYADRPVNASKGAVDITNDIDTLEQRTGMSGFDQGVMRLMGHDALMDGEFDGSVLAYTAGNANSLDSNKHSDGNSVDNTVQTLLAQDKADDGQVNGTSIINNTVSMLDKLYA